MSKLSWHDRKRGNSGMHLVLYRKQSCESKSIKRANFNVAREKGAVAQVRINTVTIERKKFNEVYRVFLALYSSSRLFQLYLCFLLQIMYSRWKTQTSGAFF